MAVKSRKRIKTSKTEYCQEAAQEFMAVDGVTEFDPEEVSQWMVDTQRYEEPPRSKVSDASKN